MIATLLGGLRIAAAAASVGSAPFIYAHHSISNATPALQAAFDRGLTLYYAYNGGQGVRVFQAATESNPMFAMGYWGMALCYGPDINTDLSEEHFRRAHTAIEKAVTLEASVDSKERAYIEALRLRYAGAWRDHEKAEGSYRAAMANAVARYPDDDDLATLYAEALLEHTGQNPWKTHTNTPTSGETLTMRALLDRVIARNPTHIMANHLQIHLFENAQDHSRSIVAAKRFDAMRFAPEDEHLEHMPAHAWIDIGNYALAVASSSRAVALFDQYLAEPGIDRTHHGYLGHDIEVGWGAALMLGNYALAKSFAGRLGSLHDTKRYLEVTALRFGRRDDLDATFTHYAAILAGDSAAARSSAPLDGDEKDPMAWAIAGRAQLLKANRTGADTDFRKAQALEDDQFGGEELPRLPVGEIEGFGYYRNGDLARADAAFRATLKRYPNDPRALYGLSQTLQKQNRGAEAQRVAADFRKAWQGADTTLSITAL